jgi:energy-coupling factor transporter ATP-binding protein EcfA2
MTVFLSVSDVRQEIFRRAGETSGTGAGEPSQRLLGSLFHRLFASLVERDSPANLEAALSDVGLAANEWQRTIVEHAYQAVIGPALEEHRGALQDQGAQVLTLWTAVHELAEWLSGLCHVIATLEELSPREAARRFVKEFVTADEHLECVLRRPDWSDDVRLTGIADAIVRVPGKEVSCLVELKLGRTAPEADLAQACLYRLLMRQSGSRASAANDREQALTVVNFLPERHERLLSEDDITAAAASLVALIGELAGVVRHPGPPGTEVDSRAAVPGRPATSGPALTVRPADRSSEREDEQQRAILELYREFDIRVEPAGDPLIGPTFVRYRFRPGKRVMVRQLERYARELQVRLGLEAPPVFGTDGDTVTIDLCRADRREVLFSEVRPQLPAADELTGSSHVPIGVDLNGTLQCADFARPENCHLLVAGTTGSGKSEWLRTALAGLVVSNTPETLRLVLIDPKRNAFLFLVDNPFLYRPVVFPDGGDDVIELFDELIQEMEVRYKAMNGAPSLEEHVRRTGLQIPRIVCLCDEYADLVTQEPSERRKIEQRIKRLGVKARAAGIHLVLATQDPRREVVTGTIKGNLPSRVALKTAEDIESRTVLGQSGAEDLLGRGDLFFKDIGAPRRLQGVYVPESEIHALFAPMPGRR